jgi:hypothetical protein
MVEEEARRRVQFEEGMWVRMGDGQAWMFPHPPAPGVDREYDDLVRCRHESEDANEALRAELALAIKLLSRNYNPRPDEYAAIFSFGADRAARWRARAAIAELIDDNLDEARLNRQPGPPATVPFRAHFRTLRRSLSSCAVRVRSRVAARRHG